MKLAKQQRGLTFISWMVVLALVGFLALFLIKLTPAYMEYFNVRSVMQSFKTDQAQYASAESVRKAVEKRFSINDVKTVSASDVVINPEGGGFSLQLDYEVRVPFIANVSLVSNFSESGHARSGSE